MGREMHADWLISLFIVCSREEGKMQAVWTVMCWSSAPCVQFRELPLALSWAIAIGGGRGGRHSPGSGNREDLLPESQSIVDWTPDRLSLSQQHWYTLNISDDEVKSVWQHEWNTATVFPSPILAHLSIECAPAGWTVPTLCQRRLSTPLPTEQHPLQLWSRLPRQAAPGEPEHPAAAEHPQHVRQGERVRGLQGDHHQEGEHALLSQPANSDEGMATHRHLLLHPWSPLSPHIHIQVQGDHSRGPEKIVTTRVSQCFITGRSS